MLRASMTLVTSASAHGVFGGVALDFGDDQITLLGVQATQLDADDFLI